MARKYPRYQHEHAPAVPGAECSACDKPASHKVRIAWSYMRGDDEWDNVCPRHFKMIESIDNADRFFAHQATKDRYLKSKSADEGAA